MHLNFYHWHAKAELKPDTEILPKRWEAAAKFSENLSVQNVCGLLRIAFFPDAPLEFAKRFTEALVKLEPTFPPSKNAELLRVMATAALYSQMEAGSSEADAIALGIQASAFPEPRIQPICEEVTLRAAEYLAAESERVRPTPDLNGKFANFEEATANDDWAGAPEATKMVGDALLDLGETLGRVSEENQFLWWLLGRRSPLLDKRREKLAPKDYALAAAVEAAKRVTLLPPPASVEALIAEVLSHCDGTSTAAIKLVDLVDVADSSWVKDYIERATKAPELVPITSLLQIRLAGGKIDAPTLERLQVSGKLKISPAEAARQFFRELMFLKALEQLA